MSIFSAKTGISSILKTYSPAERDKAKHAAINKVRFEMPKKMGIVGAIEAVLNYENYALYNDFVSYLKESNLNDEEFIRIIKEARQSVHLLKPTFSFLVENLLSLEWISRDQRAVYEYVEFYVDLLVAHSKYINFAITKLIEHWIPNDAATDEWPNASPTEKIHNEMKSIHNLLERLLGVIPLIFDVVLDKIEEMFPYYKKPSHVLGGYLHNVLWLLEYRSDFTKHAIKLIFQRLLILDVNAPRSEIEDEELEEDEEDARIDEGEEIFQMEECNEKERNQTMNHPIAETLDICMEKLFNFLDKFKSPQRLQTLNPELNSLVPKKSLNSIQLLQILLDAFEDVILPSHNTHHVQFLIYYYSSFKNVLAEKFLSTLWNKVKEPNVSAPIRQAAVGYLASFLARSKFLSIILVKHYLLELCNWAHQYISRSDSIRSNNSLKGNIVFYSVCQAVFYVIAFRSRDLTTDKHDLFFLQSLQLSALVSCNFNPLRVCLPAVATAFAGVTRAYQLAYCHTILERNARRKLATVYANEISTPEETLETFFPFDPYLLKKSGNRIERYYLQYQASEAEEESAPIEIPKHRKRGDSEMADDIDDFIIMDKKQKFSDISKSIDKDAQFTYGLSPGFQM